MRRHTNPHLTVVPQVPNTAVKVSRGFGDLTGVSGVERSATQLQQCSYVEKRVQARGVSGQHARC